MTLWFDDIRVAGALSDEALSEKLGESVTTTTVVRPVQGSGGRFALEWLLGVPAWRHTSHSFGFIPAGASGPGSVRQVSEITPDPSLKDVRLRISLMEFSRWPTILEAGSIESCSTSSPKTGLTPVSKT